MLNVQQVMYDLKVFFQAVHGRFFRLKEVPDIPELLVKFFVPAPELPVSGTAGLISDRKNMHLL
jgi:hypothetical protein